MIDHDSIDGGLGLQVHFFIEWFTAVQDLLWFLLTNRRSIITIALQRDEND